MYDPMTVTYRALGNHRRRLIFEAIWESARQKPPRGGARPFATITELARRLKLAQPAVSQYVEKLVRGRLVDIKRLGNVHLCIPNEETVRQMRDYFGDFLRE